MKMFSIKNILLILLVSAALALITNFLSKNSLSLIREKQTLQFSDSLIVDENLELTSEIIAVTLDQAKNFFNENSAQFIDARDNWDFSDGHIKSAINIPEFSFEPTDSVISTLDKSAKYVVYCSSNDCDISRRLANEMQKLGFTSLYVFLDGYEVWLQNNLPIDSEVSND